MEELQELLSLANFEADKSYEPYLNTPRSLEACRLNGVNPIELVEIPISEFQKDFPNDPDAVQRRYERIDGARRRILGYVLRDWKQLCASGWKPPVERPQSAKESIVHVSAGAHCTLLELQAQRFRKIENDNWDALNRQLKLELKQAEIEQKNKLITQKHEEIQSSNDNMKRERQLMVEALHKEEMERQKKKQEDEAERIHQLQIMDSEAAKQKKIQEEQNRLREKRARERRELERVQREEYTKQLKNSIISGLENKTEAKKKVLEIRDKSMQDRVEQTRREREQMLERRRQEKEQRLTKAREDQQRQDEEDRQEMLNQIAQNEEKRARILEQRERERKELLGRNEDETREKLAKIKEVTGGVVNVKAERTLQAIQAKEELARQELQRVKEAQEKRRCIKSIRQEAYKMASLRAKKAQEYRMLKIAADLKNKDERCEAIKKGFFALDHMRNSMKDIMEKTNAELRHEMHQLRHKDNFSPERVVKKALEVGNNVLFPRLERTFGISDSPFGRAGSAALLGSGAANLFPSEFSGDAGRAKSSGDALFGRTDDFMPAADVTLRNSTGATNAGTSAAVGAPARGAKAHQHTNRSGGRKGFEPLPIQTMTHDRLQCCLAETKARVLGSSSETQRYIGANTNGDLFRNFEQDDGDEEESVYPEAPAPILKLPEDGNRSPSTTQTKGKQKSQKGLNISLSPSTSQSSVTLIHFLPSPTKHGGVSQSVDDSFKHANSNAKLTRSEKKQQQQQGQKASVSSADDVKLPMFKFDPLRQEDQQPEQPGEKAQQSQEEETGGGGFSRPTTPGDIFAANASSKSLAPNASSKSFKNTGSMSLSKKLRSSFSAEINTETNDKASFLDPPPGKFRREFSKDHPLAKGGTGKYTEELKKGITPTGLKVDVPDQLTRSSSSVAEALGKASKIERLTYSAQRRVVDPKSQIEALKKQQNEALKRIVMEERDAEAGRDQALRSISDPRERQNLEGVFSEERRRASDRIIEATRQHEEAMKAAVLSLMDLGAGSVGYGKDEARLPMSNFFQ